VEGLPTVSFTLVVHWCCTIIFVFGTFRKFKVLRMCVCPCPSNRPTLKNRQQAVLCVTWPEGINLVSMYGITIVCLYIEFRKNNPLTVSFVDLNKNCNEYTYGTVDSSDNVEIRYSLRPMS